MKKVVHVQRAQNGETVPEATMAKTVLAHDDRHLRRKTLRLSNNEKILIDLPEPSVLQAGDVLLLEDGSSVMVEAALEDLFEVRGQDSVHLTQLAWHIGNRHLPAEISADRILILRDHVIRTMLEGLGASVTDITGPFTPTRGAYDGQPHSHAADHGHGHHHHD